MKSRFHIMLTLSIFAALLLAVFLLPGGCRDKNKDKEKLLLAIAAANGAGCGSWTETSTGGECPDGRCEHTAVWTGTKMIVWGGRESGLINTGSVYDPAMDSWTTTSTGAGCPSGRYDHTAVAADNNMIVWGGSAYSGPEMDDGGVYDPDTDTWTPTSLGANCPTGRIGHTAVWMGNSMIIWGGERIDWTPPAQPIFENTGALYDPQADTWSPTSTGPSCPEGRSDHTAVWTGSEMIVWGGIMLDGFDYVSLNDGGKYDPSTNTWTPISTGAGCPSPRDLHTAVWAGNRMIIWGGRDDAGYPINDGAMYDPQTDTWTAVSSNGCPTVNGGYTVISTGSEMIVWGGAYNLFISNTGAIFDPQTDTWRPTFTGTGCPVARKYHSAVWTGSSMIIWGGLDANIIPNLLNTGGIFTP